VIVYGPLKSIRLTCLDCSGGSPHRVAACEFDGLDSDRCHLYAYRFGKRPSTAARERHRRDQPVLLACPTISPTPALLASGRDPKPKSIKDTTPGHAIRKHCLGCSGGNATYVLWCTCDGIHSSRCHLWPYRLGIRPATALTKYPALVTPEAMPPATTCLDDLPTSLPAAVEFLPQQAAGRLCRSALMGGGSRQPRCCPALSQ
jgi:hypothetical protein